MLFFVKLKKDSPAKSPKRLFSVIPAKAGIKSFFRYLEFLWIPVFTGMTTFYEIIKKAFV